MNQKSLRDQILACDDIEKRTITIKQWGNMKVDVIAMTADQRFRAIGKSTDKKGNSDNKKATLCMIIESLYDPKTGDKIFTDEDLNALAGKTSAAIEQVSDVMLELNGLGDKEQKESEKN